MDRIGIENLSTFGLGPVELVHLAADLGCRHVSLNLGRAANRLAPHPPFSLRDDPVLVRTVRAALAERGVAVSLLEGFAVLPDQQQDYGGGLDIAAELGARAVCTVSLDKEAARTHGEYARLTEMAAERGLLTATEACAGVWRRLHHGVEAAAAVGIPAFGLLIDTMHFFRSGSTIDDLVTLDPALIHHVQLCDVPMPAVMESYMEEALYERRCPGEGDLPLGEFLSRVPGDVPVGLEIPIRSEFLAGRSDRERLGRCVAAARALL